MERKLTEAEVTEIYASIQGAPMAFEDGVTFKRALQTAGLAEDNRVYYFISYTASHALRAENEAEARAVSVVLEEAMRVLFERRGINVQTEIRIEKR